MDSLILNGQDLTLEDIFSVAYEHRKVEISKESEERAKKARQVLFDMAARGKGVYGLNRGVGWNKDREFDQDFFETYNRNLLNTHSLGIPPYHDDETVRAILLIRLQKALLGHTGISMDILHHFKDFLNHEIHPLVPIRSSIGEGDITTLSHIGLAFIGEENVRYGGRVMNSKEAMEKVGLKPVVLGPKDGLGILSCNAQSEAMTASVIKHVESLLQISNLIYCLSLEGLNGVVESLREDVNAARALPGQMAVAKVCRENLEQSYLYDPDPDRALQDPLCFRCGHAINGSVLDALEFVKQQFLLAINHTDDNPCILIENDNTYVSANFENTSLAMAVEMLAIALSHMSKTSCYRMIKLADPAFTKLTRFLTPEDVTTIAYGTIQKTFTMLDTQNRNMANPSSMDFYSLAGTIEDHANNLPLIAHKVDQMIDNIRYILGIEAMHAVQAIDLRRKMVPGKENMKLGKKTERAYEMIRREVPYYDKDRNISKDIMKAYELIRSNKLLNI